MEQPPSLSQIAYPGTAVWEASDWDSFRMAGHPEVDPNAVLGCMHAALNALHRVEAGRCSNAMPGRALCPRPPIRLRPSRRAAHGYGPKTKRRRSAKPFGRLCYNTAHTCVNWTALSSEELIRACVKTGDEAGWEEFVRRFRPVIAGTVMRTARRFRESAPQLIDDLVQDTYLKICANRCRILREFQPEADDAIFGLLKTVAFSVAQDYFRGGLTVKRGAGRHETPLDSFAESAVAGREGLPEMEREILIREIDELLDEFLAAAEPPARERHRQIFWLYYRQGLTAREIALIPGIGLTQKGVESVIQRLTNHVRARLAEWKLGRLEGKSSESSL